MKQHPFRVEIAGYVITRRAGATLAYGDDSVSITCPADEDIDEVARTEPLINSCYGMTGETIAPIIVGLIDRMLWPAEQRRPPAHVHLYHFDDGKTERERRIEAALRALMDAIDFRPLPKGAGGCTPNEMIGALIDPRLFDVIDEALKRGDDL